MDWKLLATTFTAIFIAELGDKTQLATLTLASGQSRLAVFLGAAAALVCSTAVAVLLGTAVGRWVPEVYLKRGAGVVFIALGVMYLVRS